MIELTIPLEYLTRFNEQSCLDSNLDMAWKGYVVNIINELDKKDYIQAGSRRFKPMEMADEIMKLSRE